MKKFILLLLVPVLLLSACSSSKTPILKLGGQRFQVEVAESDEAKALGLMHRDVLPEDQGMLFVYQDSTPRIYWMKDMKIPIDILFFNEEKKLVDLYSNVPPCAVEPCSRYPSHSPAQYVLELAPGTAQKLKLMPGDKFSL